MVPVVLVRNGLIQLEPFESPEWQSTLLGTIPSEIRSVIYRYLGREMPLLKKRYKWKADIKDNQLSHPFAVAIDSKGDCWISDTFNHVVRAYTPQGRFIRELINVGVMPCALAFDHDQNLVVASDDGVHVFDPYNKGRLVRRIGKGGGKEPGWFGAPRGVAIDHESNYVICDYTNNRIQIFKPNGEFLATFGSYGNGCNQMAGPAGVAIDAKGNMIVAEYGNNRVQIFDCYMQSIRILDITVSEEPLPVAPWAVAVDKRGTIVVAFLDGKVQIIFPGEKEHHVLKNTPYPSGVAISQTGDVVVVDGRRSRVQIFGPKPKQQTQK